MIQAINTASNSLVNYEYLKIIQELRSLGLSPTGDKNTDARRLQFAKEELIKKIHHKEATEHSQSVNVQVINPVDGAENAMRSEMEEQRLGAMTVAQLNRIYFGL